ncbi:replication protein A 70 kDa DNA-binding subunit A-like isoform X2 [Silene latifolia]|uniref:replication protein A 70 kDa DNA-binding subunit A-like isoform X2 n=1 Tax=Silene latifolia TaxID=37657 RepID=UPI003D774631
METVGLTEGAIATICTAEGTATADLQPVVQVTDIRLVNTKNTMSNTERYRLLLSDGVHSQQGMLATQKNALVKNGELQKGSIVQLYEFICNNIQNRKIIIITQLEVLQQICPVIGDPKQYPQPGASVSSSVGQAAMNHAHVQPGNSHAAVPGPTYLESESGRFPQPKLESGAQMQYPPRGASVSPSVGKAEVNHAHIQPGNSHAAVPGPTYLESESGRFPQPKLESGAQMQYPPRGASVSPTVGKAEVNHAHVQPGNSHAAVPGPTYLESESGRLPQPKPESGAQMQSNGRPSTVKEERGRYAVNNGPPVCHESQSSAGVSGNAVGSGTYGVLNDVKTNISGAPSSNYTRPQQPMYRQQPSMYMNRGPVAKNEAPPRIVPIAALNPFQGRWTIKARVTAKGELRHYNNARGEGKVFSFDLLDSDGGEIRVTCFNAVVDQFHDVIEVGKVYLISKGSLKPAQKTFNHLPNDHEILLDTTSMVQPCHDDDNKIPRLQFHFHPISDIEGLENNSFLDVIGVVTSISPTATIMKKNGTETQKRSLQLRDKSGRSVEFTMWGNFCNSEGQILQNLCDSGNFPVLALKAVRVSEFNGKALGSISSSQIYIEPDNPEARELKLWFNREGRNMPYVSISRETTSFGKTDVRKTVSQIKDEKLGTSEKPDWITVCATLSFMKMDNFCYPACPLQIGDRQCNKKVLNNGDGKWRCDRCDQSVDECDYRYILQFQIQDHTGLTWATAFQESGEELLGMSAKDLFDLKYDKGDDEAFQETVRAALFRKYIFKLKVKEETYNDEPRVKSTVVKVEKVNFATESKFLSDMMQKLTNGDSGLHAKQESISPNIGTDVGMTPSSSSGIEMGGFNSTTSQYGNQYNGGYGGASASGLSATCTSCGGTGHSSANCPSIINGPGQPSGNMVNRAFSGGNTGSSTSQVF